MEIVTRQRGVPTCDIGIAALPLSDLRDDIGIDQVVQRSTSRPVSLSRDKSMPSSGAEASNAFRSDCGS